MKKILSFVLATAMMLSLLTGLVLFETSAAGKYEYHFKMDKYTDRELRKFWSTPDEEKVTNCVQTMRNKKFSDYGHGIPETPAIQVVPSEAATEAPMMFAFSQPNEVMGYDYLYSDYELPESGSMLEGIDLSNKKTFKVLIYGINSQEMNIQLYLMSSTEKMAWAIPKDGMPEPTGRMDDGTNLKYYEAVYKFNLDGAVSTDQSKIPGAPLTDYYGKIDNIGLLFTSGWYVEWIGLSKEQNIFLLDMYTEAYTDTTELLKAIQKADELGMNTELVKEAKALYKNVNNVSQERVDTMVDRLNGDVSFYEYEDGKYTVPGFSRYSNKELEDIDKNGVTVSNALNGITVEIGDGSPVCLKSGKEDNGVLANVNENGVFAGHDLSNKTAIGFKVTGYKSGITLKLRSSTSDATAEYTVSSPDANGVYEFVLDGKQGGHGVMDGVEITFNGLFAPNTTFTITDWYVKAPIQTAKLFNVLKEADKYGPANMGMTQQEYESAWAVYDNLSSTQEQVDEAVILVESYVNAFDYDRFVAMTALNDLLETADMLGLFDDEEDPVYDIVCEADMIYANPDSTTEDFVKQADILRGVIAAVTMDEDVYEAYRKCRNAWEYNYTPESYAALKDAVLKAFEMKDEAEPEELIAMLEEAYANLELLDIYRHTITGVTDWYTEDMEDLMLANADKIGENVDGDHDFSNDSFFMSTGDDGITYFNMYCEEDRINMGYKTMDRSGEALHNGYKGDAYPHNDFFGDMKGYFGIRFKLLCDGHFDSFVFKISNCSTRYSLYMETAVHDITMDSVDSNGYINLPFSIFVSDSWVDDSKANLMKNLDKAIVMVVEAKGATAGTTVSVGDFCIYTEYAEDYPEIGGTIENGGVYDLAQADNLYTTFESGTAKLDGKAYASGTPVAATEGKHRIHHKYGSLEKTIDFEIVDKTPVPVISGVEEGKEYDIYTQDAPIVTWDVGEGTLNDKPIVSGTEVKEPGEYKLVVTNGTKSAEVNFKVTDTATVPVVNGVENGKEYDLYKEAAPAATWDVGEATLNGVAYTAGTPITEIGSYVLMVVNGSKSTTVNFTVVDTATVPVISGVEDGKEYDLYKEAAPAATWDVGEATLNGVVYTAGTPITEIGSYVLIVVNGSKSATVNFKVIDTATVPVISGVEDGKEYDLYKEAAPAATWDVGEATLNGVAYTAGTPITEIGSYVLMVVNGSKSATVEFKVTDTAAAPVIEGVEDGKEYDLYKETAPAATWNVGEATLNGVVYTAGTPITEIGDYTLIVTNGSKSVTVNFKVKDTATVPVVEGVEDGKEYDLHDVEAPAATWDVGEATLDGAAYTAGTPVTEVGEHIIKVVNGSKTAEIKFTVKDTSVEPEVEGVEDGQEYDLASGKVVLTWGTGVATLNGAVVESGVEITEPGEYTLVVTDGTKTKEIKFTVTDTTPATKKGDFDNDGEITVADALAALRIAAKLVEEDANNIAIGDIDADNHVTVADALAILRVAAKLTDTL